MGLVLDGQIFSLLRLKGIFGEEHWVIVCFSYIGLPVSLRVVEGVYEVFVGLEVVENFSVLGDEVIDLLSFCLETIQLRHQIFLDLQFIFNCSLRFFCLFLDAFDELMHELHIIFKIQLPGLESLLLILDGILQLGGLLLLDIDVHLREVDLFLLLQELMDRFLLLCVTSYVPFRRALTLNFFYLLLPWPTLVMKSPSWISGFSFLKM